MARVITGRETPPVGGHRAGVGGHTPRPDPVGAEIVGTRELRHRHERLHPAGHGVARVRTDVAQQIGVHSHQPSSRTEGTPYLVAVVPAVERRDQILAAVLDPCDRGTETPGHPDRDHILHREAELLAEPSPYVRGHHPEIRLGHTEQVGDDGSYHMGRLDRGCQGDPAGPAVVSSHGPARFQRHGALPTGAEVELDHRLRRPEGFVHPGGSETGIHHHVPRNVVVDGGGSLPHRFGGGDRMVHRVDVHEDLIGNVLRLLGRRGHNHRDRFSHETDLVPGQHRLVNRLVVLPVQHRPGPGGLRPGPPR